MHKVHPAEKELPTVDRIREQLKKSLIYYKERQWNLTASLKSLELRWKMTKKTNKNILIQKQNIKEQKLSYMEAFKCYRDDNRLIVYMDDLNSGIPYVPESMV
jgi:hypothetical protein